MSDLYDGPKEQMKAATRFQGRATRAAIRAGVEPEKASLIGEELALEGIDDLYAKTFESSSSPSAPEITSGYKSWAKKAWGFVN